VTFVSDSGRLRHNRRSSVPHWHDLEAQKPDNPEIAATGAESEEPRNFRRRGVPNDMSSMAIGGLSPFQQQHWRRTAASLQRPRTLLELDDAQVMLRVRDGDDAAFNYLISRYRRR